MQHRKARAHFSSRLSGHTPALTKSGKGLKPWAGSGAGPQGVLLSGLLPNCTVAFTEHPGPPGQQGGTAHNKLGSHVSINNQESASQNCLQAKRLGELSPPPPPQISKETKKEKKTASETKDEGRRDESNEGNTGRTRPVL
jgi:hypothetical protein